MDGNYKIFRFKKKKKLNRHDSSNNCFYFMEIKEEFG